MSTIIAMTAKRVASPIFFPRLTEFHRDMQYTVTSFPGYIKSQHYIGVQTNDENLMFTFSEWDHKQFWDIWESSKKRTEIIDNYWSPSEIKIKTFILNKPQQDLFLL